MTDITNIMLNHHPMIGLSLWTPSERSWEAGNPLFISILKLGQVLMDFYLGELLLSMVDLSNIMLNLLPMIGLSLWKLQKGPGKLGTTFYFHHEAGDHFLFPSWSWGKFWWNFYLGELLLSMVDLSNIMQTFFQWLDWVSGTFRKVQGSWGPLFIYILKLGQVLMDFYLGELLLSMVDLTNIMLNLLPMIGLSLWKLQKGPGKLGTTFYFHYEAGDQNPIFFISSRIRFFSCSCHRLSKLCIQTTHIY